MLLEKMEYDIIAQKLESDLSERLTRIHWKVSDYDGQLLRAEESREWWTTEQHEDITVVYVTPEETFESSMSAFHIGFSIQIEGEKLTGHTEIDGRLIIDPLVDAIPIIGEMVSCEIANKLTTE